VISESMAKKYWPNQDSIGHTFRLQGEKDRKLEVVGIVRDAEFRLFSGGKTQPWCYLPYVQHVPGNSLMVFQLRTEGNPLALAATVEKTIHSLAPDLPVFQVQTMRQGLYTLNGLLLFQIGATLAAVMGGLGLTLAVIGIYGVVSYAAGRRTREFGIRAALGATAGRIVRVALRDGTAVLACGAGIGVPLALLAIRPLVDLLPAGVDPWDPAPFLAVIVLLLATGTAAAWIPARRAAKIDPAVALRQE